MYSKLPRGFLIPTPVGNYNPTWEIAFREGTVKHIFFVAETKGAVTSLLLRNLEESKFKCAEKFFVEINAKYHQMEVQYNVVNNFETLLARIGGSSSLAARSGKVPPFQPVVVEPSPEERYVSCLPLVRLQAAAGASGEPQNIADSDREWVRYTGSRKLQKGIFVAQVVGKSMEPLIPFGSYCLFNSDSIEGT